MGLVATAVADGVSSLTPEADSAVHEANMRLAIEATRVDISPVPGSGIMRGVWARRSGKKYAFRDNVGGTACVMYESSSSGWTIVNLGNYIAFGAGTSRPAVGSTVTGVDSGATGIVIAVGKDSGTWAGNDAAGRIYLKTISGTFQAESITFATCLGAQAVVTMLPGGRFELINYNFGGQLGTRAMYGADGVNKAFQFDGTGFAFIHTGMIVDTPKYIIAHKKHLFLSFRSSTQHSSIGDPTEWNAITGAAEIATGDDVVGYDVEPGDVLAIFNRNATFLLYGTSASDWNLITHSLEKGAIERTIQRMNESIYVDDRGLTKLSAVQEFGDFNAGTLSQDIDLLFSGKLLNIESSVRVREKDQYRVFFDDKTAIFAMFDSARKPSFTSVTLDHIVHVACSVENENGIEELFFGSDDGYFYQMDRGESFDGEVISNFIRLPFTNLNIQRRKKRIFKAIADIDAAIMPDLEYVPEFSFGGPNQPAAAAIPLSDSLASGGGYWGDIIWGQFIWDAQIVGQVEGYIDGSGFNISLAIRGESNFEPAHTLTGVTYHYAVRGLQR